MSKKREKNHLNLVRKAFKEAISDFNLDNPCEQAVIKKLHNEIMEELQANSLYTTITALPEELFNDLVVHYQNTIRFRSFTLHCKILEKIYRENQSKLLLSIEIETSRRIHSEETFLSLSGQIVSVDVKAVKLAIIDVVKSKLETDIDFKQLWPIMASNNLCNDLFSLLEDKDGREFKIIQSLMSDFNFAVYILTQDEFSVHPAIVALAEIVIEVCDKITLSTEDIQDHSIATMGIN